MAKKVRLSAAVVCCLTLLACAAQPDRTLTEDTCTGMKCPIKVDASDCDSGGRPKVDIDKIHIKGNHGVQIKWEIQHAGSRWEFRLGESLKLKTGDGDPTGQFSQKFLLNQNDQPDPQLRNGKKMQWIDANILVAVNEFPYKIVLFREGGDVACTLDPIIHNDG